MKVLKNNMSKMALYLMILKDIIFSKSLLSQILEVYEYSSRCGLYIINFIIEILKNQNYYINP